MGKPRIDIERRELELIVRLQNGMVVVRSDMIERPTIISFVQRGLMRPIKAETNPNEISYEWTAKGKKYRKRFIGDPVAPPKPNSALRSDLPPGPYIPVMMRKKKKPV